MRTLTRTSAKVSALREVMRSAHLRGKWCARKAHRRNLLRWGLQGSSGARCAGQALTIGKSLQSALGLAPRLSWIGDARERSSRRKVPLTGRPHSSRAARQVYGRAHRPKRKFRTAEFIAIYWNARGKSAICATKTDKPTRLQVWNLDSYLSETPFKPTASWWWAAKVMADGTKPAAGVDKDRETPRESFLNGEELEARRGCMADAIQ